MNKKILSAVCAAALLLAGCSKNEPSTKLAYEKPLNALRLAASSGDEQSYMSVWLPQEKQRFMSSENYSDDFLSKAFDPGIYDGKMKIKVKESRALADSELEELQLLAHQKYGTRFEFTKGEKMSVEIRVRKEDEHLTELRELVAVRYNNVWYLYGDTIDHFEFAGS